MSLRLRLTLWYTGILTATLCAVFILVYVVLQVFLEQQVSQLLTARERQFSQALLAAVPGPDVRGGFIRGQTANAVFGSNPDVYAQLVAPDGTPLLWTRNLPSQVQQLPVTPRVITQVIQTGRPVSQSFRDDGISIRLLNFPLILNSQTIAVVQLGRDVTQMEATIGFLREILVVAGIGGILVAFGAGWILARKALTPIQRIAETARDIGSSKDFSRRVEHPGPNDELGRLAATFNQMLDEIQVAYRQIESALAAQRRFVADASHELRTPLTTIRGNIGLLSGAHEVSGEDSREALQDMASEAERMSRLVANLLTLARADAGLHFEKREAQIDELLAAVCRQARVLAPDMEVTLLPTEPAVVLGNADYLKQLLLILVENAIKNTPAGGCLELSQKVDNGRLRIAVKDSGRGIPADALPHIFERFYQADKSRSTGGTGLGLSIAKWIVEEHGGSIEAASHEGQGSTFTIFLPCLRQAPASIEPAASGALG